MQSVVVRQIATPIQHMSSSLLKVLDEAAQIDAKAASGENILPLCGLPLAVKDSVDVVGYPTTASTPALQGSRSSCTFGFETLPYH